MSVSVPDDPEWRALEELVGAATRMRADEIYWAARRIDTAYRQGQLDKVMLGVYAGFLLGELVRDVAPAPTTKRTIASLIDELFTHCLFLVRITEAQLRWILNDAAFNDGGDPSAAVAPFDAARFVVISLLLGKSSRDLTSYRSDTISYLESRRDLIEGMGVRLRHWS